MNFNRNTKNIDINFIFFIIISIFYLFGNLLWYKLNNPIIIQGEYNNYFARALIEGQYFFEITPLIIWIMKACLNIFGKKYFDLEIIFINYFFFLMALYYINKICIELKSKETGRIAMILFALTPCIYGASRQYGHHDYHIMCISLLNIYALIKTTNFTNRKWSIIYGISVGLGLLAKDSFLAYFFIPYLYVVIISLIEKTKNKKNKIINIILTILIGSLIVACHYFKMNTIIKILKDPFLEANNFTYSFKEFRIFTIGFCEYMLSFPIFLLSLLGILWYILKYKNIKYRNILLLWLIVPWVVLMNMPHHRHPDYGLGLIPPIIIIVSIYIYSIKRDVYRNILLIVLVVICLWQYISLSYGINLSLYNNLKINFNGYNFYYFDINQRDAYFPNLVIYDNEERDYALSFSKYLRDNFKGKTICVYKVMLTSFFSMEEISTLLRLQNCSCNIILDVREDKINSDIIVFTKKDSYIDTDYLFNITKKFYFESLKEYNEQDLKKHIEPIINNIKNNYIKLDEVSLYNNAKEQDYIIILGKKNLFENNSELKYKYKHLKFNRFKTNR